MWAATNASTISVLPDLAGVGGKNDASGKLKPATDGSGLDSDAPPSGAAEFKP
jgi:hypothetical protein